MIDIEEKKTGMLTEITKNSIETNSAELNLVIVKTKDELEKAINEKAQTIVVEGPFAEDFKKQLDKKRRAKKVAVGCGISGGVAAVAGVVAGIALAPVTGGASLAVGGVAAVHVLTAVGTATGVAGTAAVGGLGSGVILGLGGFVAAVLLVAIIKDYNVEVEGEIGKKMMKVKLTRKNTQTEKT